MKLNQISKGWSGFRFKKVFFFFLTWMTINYEVVVCGLKLSWLMRIKAKPTNFFFGSIIINTHLKFDEKFEWTTLLNMKVLKDG